jgi:hypothetical protein
MNKAPRTYRGRSQRYPKRQNPGSLHRMNVYLTWDAYDKADQMAAETTLSAFYEELVQREWRRREKRAEKELALVLAVDSVCMENGAVSHSA